MQRVDCFCQHLVFVCWQQCKRLLEHILCNHFLYPGAICFHLFCDILVLPAVQPKGAVLGLSSAFLSAHVPVLTHAPVFFDDHKVLDTAWLCQESMRKEPYHAQAERPLKIQRPI